MPKSTFALAFAAFSILGNCSPALAETSDASRGKEVRDLIYSIATASVQQKGKQSSEERAIGEPEYRVGRRADDGSAEGFVCQKKEVLLEQNAEEFVTLNPAQEWLYPGAVLQGNTITGGTPTAVTPSARGSGRIGLAIQTGDTGSYVADVPSMDRVTTLQSVNKLLSEYKGGTPGEVSLTFEEIHSQQHLEAMLGASVSGTNFSAGAELNVSADNKKTKMVLRLIQKFYTIVYQPPRNVEATFADDMTADELSRWVGPGNPPVYVSSVNYGRMLIATLESDLSARDLRAEFNAAYEGIVEASAEGSAKYTRDLESTKINVISYGASAAGGVTASADVAQSKSFQGIYDFMRNSGDFSVSNPGVPISYHMRSLSDQRPVRLAATTTFEKTLCEPSLFGCDGKPGSHKVLDQCNTCGGTNRCKRPCAKRTIAFGFGHGGPFHVYFDLPKTAVGKTIKYKNGAYATYKFPRCYRAKWSNVRYTCEQTSRGGVWRESKDWERTALCHGTKNIDQPHLRIFKD